MVGLELSAALDTINHQILLDRLHSDFSIDGLVLSWLHSYLSTNAIFTIIYFSLITAIHDKKSLALVTASTADLSELDPIAPRLRIRDPKSKKRMRRPIGPLQVPWITHRVLCTG